MPLQPARSMNYGSSASQSGALLGDTPGRDYSSKLELFTRFAAPELHEVIAGLGLRPGDGVLDAGCGSGRLTSWLAERVGPKGFVVGMDLSAAHARSAYERSARTGLPIGIVQGDLMWPALRPRSFGLIWSSNTINHVAEPLRAVRLLREQLRPGGRLVVGQSAFLPEMFFAWDAPLERKVIEACRQYYRDKYSLTERDTAATRSLVGLLRSAGFGSVSARTTIIERTSPLSADDERYFVEVAFRGYWGEKLRPYLERDDWEELWRLCEPTSPHFCLRRPDFHHVQTFTVVIGSD